MRFVAWAALSAAAILAGVIQIARAVAFVILFCVAILTFCEDFDFNFRRWIKLAYVYVPSSATLSLRCLVGETTKTYSVSSINPEITDAIATQLGQYIMACRNESAGTFSQARLNLIDNIEDDGQ